VHFCKRGCVRGINQLRQSITSINYVNQLRTGSYTKRAAFHTELGLCWLTSLVTYAPNILQFGVALQKPAIQQRFRAVQGTVLTKIAAFDFRTKAQVNELLRVRCAVL
jgi:hypothetical protein